MHELVTATRVAIECMTLWLEDGSKARYNAAKHINGLMIGPDGPGPAPIITGLLNLHMVVLMELMKERGVPPDDRLQAAGEYLREFAAKLPD